MYDSDKTLDGQPVHTDLGGNRYIDPPNHGDRTYVTANHTPTDPPPCYGGASQSSNDSTGW